MKFETLAIHAGYDTDRAERAIAVPIYQTSSFSFDDTAHAEELFSMASDEGNIYSRIRNPTNAALEKRIAALEGGVGALALASGQAAVVCSVMNLACSGDNLVAASELYGGTHNLLARVLPGYGISARFAPDLAPTSIARLINQNTKAVFCESISNPSGRVVDLAGVAEVAHAHGVPLIVDNTIPSPYLCRPIEHGADIVVHSVTKYLSGHGSVIGGVIVDSGRFPWDEHAARYPALVEPDPSYEGLVYTQRFGQAAFVARARTVMLRNFGACLSPFSSFLALQGIETLAVRMDRICDSALRVAHHLRTHPRVAWVRYAGLADHPDRERVARYLGGRASGLLSFAPIGGREASVRFYDALQLFVRTANIGDTRSLATCPGVTTHRQLSEDQRAGAGITLDTVRLSIGLEHMDDLLEDLDQALAASEPG